MLRAGVIGWPVAHSRSPRLHGHWLKRYGIDGDYLLLPTPPEDFASRLRWLADEGFAGANVTVPFKEAAYAACDVLDDTARRAKVVNTLVLRDGKLHGASTDGGGFLANLRAHGVDPAAGPALILGAGGAAHAIGAALIDCGAAVTFCNRSPDRAEALAAALTPATTVPWDRRAEAIADAYLLVNTTTLGMAHQPGLDISLDRAAANMAVADIVYAPLRTPLINAAAAHGLVAVEGLGMLLHQAVPGFLAWFGRQPEVDQELYDAVAAA